MVGMIRKRWFLGALSSAAIILSFFLLMQVTPATPEKAKAALLASSPNAVIVTESSAGKLITVAKVKLEKPGYIVVHEGSTGFPEKILGYSKLISEESMDVVVGLTRSVSDGETLYAALYLDDGDGTFSVKSDDPAKDSQGYSVMAKFKVGEAVKGAATSTY